MQVEEVAEVAMATAEEEEAAAAAAAERMDSDADGEDDADWALGDENLRAVVEAAELGASSSLSADDATGEPGGADGPGGWRSMMKEDGWSDEELEAELLSLDLDDDDTDADAAEDRLLR